VDQRRNDPVRAVGAVEVREAHLPDDLAVGLGDLEMRVSLVALRTPPATRTLPFASRSAAPRWAESSVVYQVSGTANFPGNAQESVAFFIA
jgi:hypothetical protein